MSVIIVIVVAVCALIALSVLALVVVGASVPALPPGAPRPADDGEQAVAALRVLEDSEGPEIPPACRTQLLRPQRPAKGTLVLWHGFTNCPAQYAEVAEILCWEGYFVLVARLPKHGNPDLLNRDLTDVSTEQLVEFGHQCIDVGAGLPQPLGVVGFSAGGAVAAWAGAARAEVSRVVAISPLVAPHATPLWLTRAAVRLHPLVPSVWVWWDPRKKEKMAGSPYMYPGFPMRSLVPYLHLSLALLDGKLAPEHRLSRVGLITNPNDLAVRSDAARRMVRRAFAHRADSVIELELARSLKWAHDFIDQHLPSSADPEQVASLILAAMGDAATGEAAAGGDPSVGGVVAQTRRLRR